MLTEELVAVIQRERLAEAERHRRSYRPRRRSPSIATRLRSLPLPFARHRSGRRTPCLTCPDPGAA
ncbi:hypothetical protein BH20ACT2_BH20ACT2_11890 [soil metagenome]